MGGGTPSTNNDAYWDGDIDWYSPAELGEQVYADRSVRRITQTGYDSCSATLLPAGKTILFTSRTGIGNTAILRRSACTNQGFQSLVVNDDTDVYFVYSMTDRIKKFAEQKASGSTFLEISGKGLAAGEFAFPSKDEQTAIGSMFKQLDHLITLHQRKCQYRGLYEYLSWEQRKLGEVASIKTGPFGSLLHAEDYVVDGIPIVTTEHFKSGFLPDEIAGLPQVSESDRARLEQYSAIEGDILFSRVGSVDVNAQVTAAQSGWLFSGRVLRARPTVSVISPNYLHYELSTDDVKRSIINRAVGGTMASINTEILEDTEISFPRSRTEQLEIGRSLGNLDSLIALHQ